MKEKLEKQIEHEEVLLQEWRRGDCSLMPKNWCTAEQEAFIKGMKHALYIMINSKSY